MITKEQVYTDQQGNPIDQTTAEKNGATSGYTNAIHLSLLGAKGGDITIGHAAVIRDPAQTGRHAK
ncbi:hypothetical protein [Streptomyces sp. NPDC093589]|uniref:hypothetical protein n=1 Tax=Streptomyces sp. NPDC093589 TaxID=3366043 RepID=UPI0037FBFFD4